MSQTKYSALLQKTFLVMMAELERLKNILDHHSVTFKGKIPYKDTFFKKNYTFKEIYELYVLMMVEVKKIPPYSYMEDWIEQPIILVDVDDTLFHKEGDHCSGEGFGKPDKDVVRYCNFLFDIGYLIYIFTGRMNSAIYRGDTEMKSKIASELERAGVCYDKILEIPKPNGSVILDDKAINPNF
jgi:hypothetical protein